MKVKYDVDKESFLQLIKDYRETKSRSTYNKLAVVFLKIANNLTYHYWYVNYTQDRKDEMVSDAVYYMCRYIDKFDLNRLNPFAYFTMIARNAFLQSINDYSRRDEMFTSIEFIDQADTKENLL